MGATIMRCPIYARILAVASVILLSVRNSSVLAIMGFLTNTDMSSVVLRRAHWTNLKRKSKTVIYIFSCQPSDDLHNCRHNAVNDQPTRFSQIGRTEHWVIDFSSI